MSNEHNHEAKAAPADGRGTDAQIQKERDIARHAIVGALAAGYAGQAHPGADHWLAAAHDAGVRIKSLELQAPAPAVPQGPVCAALGDIVSMWDQRAPSEYVTPLHMQAKRALAGQQPVSPDMHRWCAYVGGMVAHWLVSEPDAFDRLGPDRFEAAIAGIIERRLWAMPKSAATPAAPSQEPVTLTDEEKWSEFENRFIAALREKGGV